VIFIQTELPGAYLVELEPREDERGYNARTWCQREFEEAGLTDRFVQANTIYNRRRGTLRGMHYQVPPHAENKLFRVTRGAIHDVIIDLRPGSETYGRWLSVELSAAVPRMLYVPGNFAQGFQTLEDDTELAYQVSAFYAPGYERGLRHDDPAFDLDWPLPVSVISEKDRGWPDFVPAQPLPAPARSRA
jgi:dTDP-4-dehydrorhamnose 3,5-epimerase